MRTFGLQRPCRDAHVCQANTGKGFGAVKNPPKTNAKKKGKAIVVDNAEAVKKAVKLAEDSRSSPVNPEEAAKGKIDYAKVKNWGTDRQKEAGSLQLESFIPGGDPENLPFYNRLTLQVVKDKESGLLDEVMYGRLPVPVKKDMPVPESWVYTQQRYVQYLVDLQAVHKALETQVAALLHALPEQSPARSALDCFSKAKGLDRSQPIAEDLNSLKHTEDGHPGPSLHILAYTKYLNGLEGGDESSTENNALRLIAHLYATHLHQFTYGSKLGATVAQKLNLFKLNAVHLFRSYPMSSDYPDKDPFKAFKACVDLSGGVINKEQRQNIEAELPLATAHAMQLVECLAHTE